MTDESKWYESLPEEIKTQHGVTKYESMADFAKAKIELDKKIGANTVVIPGENASEDVVNDFYKKLGRPEDKTKYQLADIENFTVEDSLKDSFKDVAFKAGLDPKRANELYTGVFSTLAQKEALAKSEKERSLKESIDKANSALLAEWGAQNVDKNKQAANYALDKFGTDDVKKLFNDVGLSEHPEIVKMFFKISRTMAEDRLPSGPGKDTYTISDARNEMQQMRADWKGAFMDDRHPGHADAVKRYAELSQMVHSE